MFIKVNPLAWLLYVRKTEHRKTPIPTQDYLPSQPNLRPLPISGKTFSVWENSKTRFHFPPGGYPSQAGSGGPLLRVGFTYYMYNNFSLGTGIKINTGPPPKPLTLVNPYPLNFCYVISQNGNKSLFAFLSGPVCFCVHYFSVFMAHEQS